jgi:bile acid:Na+ symporter, BASS family
MDLKQLVMLAFQVGILCTVFGFGLKATTGDLLYLVRRPGLLVRSLLAVFVIMPALAIVLVRMFELRPTLEIALIALAISPVPPLLPKKETKAGGEHSYGLGLMAMLALLAIVTVPLSAEVLERAFARPLGASASAIARVVFMMALLPLVAGMGVRFAAPAIADRIQKPVSPLAKVLLPLAILALLAGTWRAVWAAIGDGTIVAMVAFVVAGLLVGHLLGGPEPEHSVVLALSSACRHPAIALSIAAANFPDERFGGTILLYLIVNTIVGVPYLAWRRRHLAATVPA